MTAASATSFPFFDSLRMRPLDGTMVELLGEDLKTAEKITKIVKEFSEKLNLSESRVVLTNNPDWASLFQFLPIPLKCFSEETQDKIHQASRFPLNKEAKEALDKITLVERKVFTTFSDDELKWVIGHEMGHIYLSEHFKTLKSTSIEIAGKRVADLKHDRAQERVCDFIATYLTSSESGIRALRKEIENNPNINENEEGDHPSFAERIEYLTNWGKDPRLSELFTENLLLDIGGEDFQEAVKIYQKYSR
ncbi:MAG: M48 family metalloprotease [Chlamydiota bacterium]|jgi:hypothetical protein